MEASVAATPSQGAPPAPAQPAATGQGEGGQGPTAAGKGSDFNWGLFPDVPENQRELLQPHLTNVLGHVTRMEQQMSPYKGLMDQVPPDQAQNLMTFLQNYSSNPLATFMGLGQSLHEDGLIQNPEFSPEALQAFIEGQAQGPQGEGEQPGMEGMPEWAQGMFQTLQQMEAREQAREQQAQQAAAQEESRQQEQLLATAQAQIREQLETAGVPKDLVTDEQIIASMIANKGDIAQVVLSFSNLRDGFLKGFTEQNGASPRAPTVNGDTPSAPAGGLRPRQGDSFREASRGAQQALAMSARAEGQGN